MFGNAVFCNWTFFIAVEKQECCALETHPVPLPGSPGCKFYFLLFMKQPVLYHQPTTEHWGEQYTHIENKKFGQFFQMDERNVNFTNTKACFYSLCLSLSMSLCLCLSLFLFPPPPPHTHWHTLTQYHHYYHVTSSLSNFALPMALPWSAVFIFSLAFAGYILNIPRC